MTLRDGRTWSLYCGLVHGSDKFRQVWTSQNRCEALFFLNRESHAVQIWPNPQTCVQFSNRTSLETLMTLRSGGTALHACSDLSKPARTCPQYSDHVRLLRSHFLHFRMLLFFGLASYPAEIAYLNLPNGELSNGVQVMALYWNKIVDPSRSPCLKPVDRKSLERCNL